jgi:serine/threonine-protein kinase
MNEGDVIADRFRLERLLGKGAMGTVWLAHHTSIDLPVAVKLINETFSQSTNARARFELEAKIAASIDSAHVAKVIDHGNTADDRPFIVMEYLVGESLRDRLTKRGRLTPVETARIVSHVCRAISRAHHAGLVHRDLKPDNVFIGEQDGEELVKVLDFGIAKATDLMAMNVDPTRTGALLGTPFYMSPEQAQGLKTIDYRSDLWSLGVLVFECLTGRPPFTSAHLGALIAMIVDAEVPAASSLAPDNCNAEIDVWLRKALSRDPADRFASADELAESFMVAARAVDSMGSDDRAPSSVPTQAVVVFAEGVSSDDLAFEETLAVSAMEASAPELSAALPSAPQPTMFDASDVPMQARKPWWIAVVVLAMLGVAWWLLS